MTCFLVAIDEKWNKFFDEPLLELGILRIRCAHGRPRERISRACGERKCLCDERINPNYSIANLINRILIQYRLFFHSDLLHFIVDRFIGDPVSASAQVATALPRRISLRVPISSVFPGIVSSPSVLDSQWSTSPS